MLELPNKLVRVVGIAEKWRGRRGEAGEELRAAFSTVAARARPRAHAYVPRRGRQYAAFRGGVGF